MATGSSSANRAEVSRVGQALALAHQDRDRQSRDKELYGASSSRLLPLLPECGKMPQLLDASPRGVRGARGTKKSGIFEI
jgi:hypothetical protein